MNKSSLFDSPIQTTEYLEFYLVERKPKTNVYSVMSRRHGFQLGIIKWHGPWRTYVFAPEVETIFNDSCLGEIKAFLRQLMKERRK